MKLILSNANYIVSLKDNDILILVMLFDVSEKEIKVLFNNINYCLRREMEILFT